MVEYGGSDWPQCNRVERGAGQPLRSISLSAALHMLMPWKLCLRKPLTPRVPVLQLASGTAPCPALCPCIVMELAQGVYL